MKTCSSLSNMRVIIQEKKYNKLQVKCFVYSVPLQQHKPLVVHMLLGVLESQCQGVPLPVYSHIYFLLLAPDQNRLSSCSTCWHWTPMIQTSPLVPAAIEKTVTCAVYLLRTHTVHLCLQATTVSWAINSLHLKSFLPHLPQLISLPQIMQTESKSQHFYVCAYNLKAVS